MIIIMSFTFRNYNENILDISDNGHLSYRPEEENVTASVHSNESGDDNLTPISLPSEEEQVCSVVHRLLYK